jgi:hypothetical protein
VLELRRESFQRRDRSLGDGREAGGAFALVGGKCLPGGGGALRELRHVAQPLALGAKLVLGAGLEAARVLDERSQLVEPRLGGSRVLRQLLVAPARR